MAEVNEKIPYYAERISSAGLNPVSGLWMDKVETLRQDIRNLSNVIESVTHTDAKGTHGIESTNQKRTTVRTFQTPGQAKMFIDLNIAQGYTKKML